MTQPPTDSARGVDVDAILAREIERAGGAEYIVGRQLIAARKAFRELVAAAKRANGDHVAPHDCYATGPMTGDMIADLVSCPGCELAAALAKVTP